MIKLDNVTLEYPIYGFSVSKKNPNHNNNHVGGIFKKRGQCTVVTALDSISFSLQKGDRLGLIGHNGAGKTTLLRTIAGIYSPTKGTVSVEGKIMSLFNLSLGFDNEATGYENIGLRGLYLGMTKKEIRLKQQSIAEFSELESYLDMPLRIYSAGMRARLAFSISVHIDPDILLLDESIAAGDSSFIHKAKEKMFSMSHNAKILILASHNHSLLKQICNKALILEQGKIKYFGNIEEC